MPDTSPAPQKKEFRQSAAWLLVVLVGAVFLVETLVMVLLPVLPPMSRTELILMDATLLSVLIFPIFYFLVFRPLVRNIAERQRAEEALRETSNFNELLIESLPFGMDIVDEHGHILYMSHAMENAVGRNALGEKCWDLYKDDRRQCIGCALNQPIQAGLAKSMESTGVLGGRTFEITHTGMIYRGKPAVLEVFYDITERKHAEEVLERKVEERTRELRENQAEKDRVVGQLIQAEKMAAIGTMVSGIGHEINNPLYVIMGKAEAIRDESDVAACNEHARDIIKYAKHISAIVKNLSGYIRPASQHELEKTDVQEKLLEALAMAKHSMLDDRIEIRQNFAPVPAIAAKPEEIQQVFFNIIRNGIQAMAGRGVLEIATVREGSQACIRIKDTGTGIRAEHLGKIFDPFFTTKGPDEGEGLGMYIVQKIVNKYNGTIALESQENKGTTVTIRFPGAETIKEE
ncbi:MAG: PAS domain S-box protein [Nitrosomonadales bacterium]|nr:PAS domain S-box protein [Nitrosomonadales bacterium]